jgi:hypothetical protein
MCCVRCGCCPPCRIADIDACVIHPGRCAHVSAAVGGQPDEGRVYGQAAERAWKVPSETKGGPIDQQERIRMMHATWW